MSNDRSSESVQLHAAVAKALGVARDTTRPQLAERLAELADLPTPGTPDTIWTLSQIVLALEQHVVLAPRMSPMDGTVVADTALTFAVEAVGREVLANTFKELGPDSLDDRVRGALDSVVAPALAAEGAIALKDD